MTLSILIERLQEQLASLGDCRVLVTFPDYTQSSSERESSGEFTVETGGGPGSYVVIHAYED